MPRFLIEVEHDATPAACIHAIEVLLRSGSHFLTHADWGCFAQAADLRRQVETP